MRKRDSAAVPASADLRHDRRFVEALARGLAVLRCFAPADRELGNSDIAARTGLPPATVSRLTFTLTALGYLTYAPERARYALGIGVLTLGFRLLSRIDLRHIARPAMQALAERTGSTVSLSARHHTSMVYLEVCRSASPLTMAVDVGARIPLATTAMGRALLCASSEPERARLFKLLQGEEPIGWPATLCGLDRAMRDYRQFGFVTTEGEWHADISAVGVPLVINAGDEILALSCGGPACNMTRTVLVERLGPLLVRLAAEVQAACDGR